MKHINKFRIFALNEYMGNRKQSQYIRRSIIDKFRSFPKELGIIIFDSMGERIHIKATELSPLYKKFLDSKTLELSRLGISLTYNIFEAEHPKDFFFYNIMIFFKEELTKRVHPTKKVYHLSLPDNRESILKNGLEIRTNDEWGHTLKYKPSIFATLDDKQFFYQSFDLHKYDLWEIDTTSISNKWWHDLNTYYGDYKHPQHIMTYEPIPPTALTLVKEAKDEEYYSSSDEEDEYDDE